MSVESDTSSTFRGVRPRAKLLCCNKKYASAAPNQVLEAELEIVFPQSFEEGTRISLLRESMCGPNRKRSRRRGRRHLVPDHRWFVTSLDYFDKTPGRCTAALWRDEKLLKVPYGQRAKPP